MSSFSILESVTSSVTKVIAPLLSGNMQRNSVACLEYVKQNATKNDPASVIAAIDTFAASNTMMNVGAVKGVLVDAEIHQKKPRVMAEIGAYTGYSTVRFASAQREAAKVAGTDSHYYSFEFSPEFAARAQEMVSFAGLDDQVTIIEGAFSDQLHVLKDKTVDIFFIDHDKSLYVSDTQKILASGTLQPGSLLIADNVLIPGAPEYLTFLDEHPHLKPVLHKVPLDIFTWVNDAISVAAYTE
ncbi:Catechol O-methyltransferase [Phytophthora palmivora]|uniref:catechol O-methyltransferase n=1 Tax=Phytophthora palmivora TaxID=4796 RepID=A0A2P4XFB5_9STRA|nr:Catechol O-methyltransferase [Phytophthora palmivora]